MSGDSCVVVFPSAFAQGLLPLLAANVRRILEIKGQKFDSIRRDGPVIVVDAQDPVFASSAAALLSGVRRVAIARRVEKDPDVLVPAMAEVGSNLLLSTDRFLVKVEGSAKGFIPDDLEIAATSAIIGSGRSNGGPGTGSSYDRLLYTFLARNSAYVCIFSDECTGGMPYGSQRQEAVCCIFDELSAVSCLETLRQGYRVRMAVCYQKPRELMNLAKMVNQIIPRMVSRDVELNFFRVRPGAAGYLGYAAASLDASLLLATECGADHVSLPVSPLIHPPGFVDECILDTVGRGLTPVIPLGGMTDDLFRAAGQIGLEKHLSRIEKLAGLKAGRSKGYSRRDAPPLPPESRQRVLLQPGPNNVHDILDSLQADT